jgi:lipoprotein-anchoring transpeptidase ErfK/SrfK
MDASDRQRFRSFASRRTLLVGGLAALVVALLLACYFYDSSRGDLISPGVTAGGVYVGGLRAPAARVRLRAELGDVRSRLVTVRYRGAKFTLPASQVGLTTNMDGAVTAAVNASRGGWFVGRTLTGLFDDHVNAQVPMPVTYNHRAVDDFVTHVRQSIDRPPRDASVTVNSSGHLVDVPSARGVTVDAAALRAEVARALQTPGVSHEIAAPVSEQAPHVTISMLAAKYPTYIVVDRPDFKLYFYQHLKLTHTYSIAVGQAGLETPAGLHHILDKQVDPAWHVPHSAWAGSLAGQVIPPGPGDPLVARWMAIDDQGDGIHGTDEPGSIGSAASHGCIRMLVPDVIQLYSMTPVGTPAYVV